MGLPNVEWIYTSMQISHFLKMTNKDKHVRELARSALFLDQLRLTVPLARELVTPLLGFRVKPSGKLDTVP